MRRTRNNRLIKRLKLQIAWSGYAADLRLPLGTGPAGARPGNPGGEAGLRARLVAGDPGLRPRHLGASRPPRRAHSARRYWSGGANPELPPSGGASILAAFGTGFTGRIAMGQ